MCSQDGTDAGIIQALHPKAGGIPLTLKLALTLGLGEPACYPRGSLFPFFIFPTPGSLSMGERLK